MIHQSASAATSKVVLRSLYRSLLRASSPFSQPAYASLIHRSGVAHDWEECIHRLDIKRRAAADVTKSSSSVASSTSSSSSSSNDVNNDDNKKHDNAPEKSIPKSWAQNLSRSYTDLQKEYELRKDYFDQRFGTDDFDDDDDDHDDRWETDLVMGTSSHYRHEVQYSISDDPKYILFRQLLREWFTSSSGDNLSNNNNETDNGVESNKWPKEWSPNAEGYYENGKIKQVPLMRFPSQIVSDGGLSIREMIQREFRAPSVEDRLSMELAFAKQQIKDNTSIPIVYPSSSYIDTDIRVQTAFLSLMELNRKLAWAESVGFPATSQQQKSNQEERKWKRLVQAAKGVTAFPQLIDIAEQSDNMADDINIVDDDDGSNEEPDDKTNNKKSSSTLQCGTYLIAHPLMTGYFAKSVIVLLDHTEEVNSSLAKTEEGGGGGTYGLIINRLALQSEMVESSRGHLDLLRQKWEEEKSKLGEEPMVVQGTSLELATSPKSLSSERITDNATSQGATQSTTIKGITQNIQRPISLLQAINADDLPETVVMAFGDAHVRDGGPVNLSLQMIHRKKSDQDDTNEEDEGKQKEGSTSIVGGTILGTDYDNLLESEEIYFNGDVVQASHDILKGKSDVDDYSFIIGAACWSPGQLEHEIERGCWLPFRAPPQMAMTGMCEHNDFTVPISENGDGTELAGGTKLSMFPPRPSNTATSSVAGSVGKTASQQQPSQPKERPVGDLWLSVMCALGEGEADLAYMMLNNKNVSNKLGDACDNFDR